MKRILAYFRGKIAEEGELWSFNHDECMRFGSYLRANAGHRRDENEKTNIKIARDLT